MDVVEFTVDGIPTGKGRPRFARTPNGVRTYTPEETVSFENLVRYTYSRETGGKKMEGPLLVIIKCYFPVPASTSKKKREQMLTGGIDYTKKPDCDNLAKSVLDALNGLAYDDDKQVTSLHVMKEYGDRPRTEIVIQRYVNPRMLEVYAN